MQLARPLVIVAVVAVAACTGKGPDPAAADPPPRRDDEPAQWDLVPPRLELPGEDVEVVSTRAPCPGCARDRIRLGSDGVVRIDAGSGEAREGKIPPIVVDMLVRHARDTGHRSASPRREDGGPAVLTVDVGDDAADSRFAAMIEAAALLADWRPPPPDERPEQLRRDLCIRAQAELAHGDLTTPLALRISPLGRWPAWSARPQPLCLDTSVPIAATPVSRAPRLPELREVTLRRGGCHGECPVYRARLRADGRVLFDGEASVHRQGVSLGRVPPVLVEMLAAYAVDTGFLATPEHHGGTMTDVSRKATSLALTSGRTWTTSLGGADNGVPAAIEGFERMIDAALTMTTWDLAPLPAAGPADELRRLCAPVLAEARARCSEALTGVAPYVACYFASVDADAVLDESGGPTAAAVRARCEYLAGVLPDPPSRAATPTVALDGRCRPLLERVRARCVDVYTPEATAAPPPECITWRERLATFVRRPYGGALCEKHAEELARALP